MLRGVAIRRSKASLCRCANSHGMRALRTELRYERELRAAVRTGPSQWSGTFLAELGLRRVLMLAPGTLHAASQRIGAGTGRTSGESLCWQAGRGQGGNVARSIGSTPREREKANFLFVEVSRALAPPQCITRSPR